MRVVNHTATPEEIAAVQVAFVNPQGVYPSPIHAARVLNTNGGNVAHAIQLFREGLDLLPGNSLGEKVYADATGEHARGQAVADAWVSFSAPAPLRPSPTTDPALAYSAQVLGPLQAEGIAPEVLTAALRRLAAA